MMSDEPQQENVRKDGDATVATIAEAAALHQAGKLDEAARIYREILARSRFDFDANHLLGVVALQQGKFDTAQRLINIALALRPNDVAAVGNLGVSYLRDGQLEPALQWFELAVKLQPDSLAALKNLGETLYHLGRHRAAIPLLEKACAVDPSSYEAYNLLGACCLQVGDDHNAAKAFEEATRVRPDDAEAWANLSVASKAIGQDARARDCADKAVRLRSESPVALDALAQTQFEQGRIAEAVENYRRGVPLVAPSVNMLLSYAYTLIANGLNDAAIQQLERARALDDKNLTVRWVLAIAQIKTIYESESEIPESRKLFAKSLDEIESWYASMPGIEAPDRAVGAVQPFWLAYHPYNNRDLLKRYGALCVTFMSKLPRRGGGLAQNGVSPVGRKLRIGIVSSFISEHSIWTAITRGWVHHLDRDRFEISVFHLSTIVDRETESAIDSVAYFDNRAKNFPEWVDAISCRQLDVVLYPEIGCDALTVRLAALRLAPIQAVAWGHPETSGLPTIDLFLSAQAFEPAGAAKNNYSEKLIALPNLGVYVEPLAPPNVDPDLRSLKLPENQPLLLCPGQPFKYTPQYDEVWVQIAKGLQRKAFFRKSTGGRLVFFRSQYDSRDRILEKRLRSAFARGGVDFDAHVSIIPFLDRASFFGLMRRSALMLDTLGFSGFNTALQAIECELPILAFDGDFMRGRLASGILREIDMPELIAKSREDFVKKAVALAKDPVELRALRSKIIARRAGLFRNLAPVRALEVCLSEAAASLKVQMPNEDP
jgi:protein O-GlcNAc transferase